MVSVLVHPISSIPFSSPLSSSLHKKSWNKEALMQKIENLQKRMVDSKAKLNKIELDQTHLHQIANKIELDQEKIEEEQKIVQYRQQNFDDHLLQMNRQHTEIKSQTVFLIRQENDLSIRSLHVQQTQKALHLRFNQIDAKRQYMHQFVLSLHRDLPLIRAMFVQSRLRMGKMESNILLIEQKHRMSETAIKAIEIQKENIQNEIAPFEMKRKATSSIPFKKLNKMEKKKMFPQTTLYSLIKKIYGLCLAMIATIWNKMAQVKDRVGLWNAKANFSLTQPAMASFLSLIAMGGLAITGMINFEFSWQSLVLKSSFSCIYLKT